MSAAANSELAPAAELGCTVAQSYHVALPMPADDLLARSWVHLVRAQL